MCENKLAGILQQLEAMDRARLTGALTLPETIHYNRLAAKERRLLRRVAVAASNP